MDRSVLDEKLLALKRRYVLTVPERIDAIAATLAGWRDGGSETTDQLELQFHTLAGTAGTYELKSIAAVAALGEEACVELDHAALDADDFTYFSFLVGQLQCAVKADGDAPRLERQGV
jgi:HPt (histidine-containing phosphotransfer) domain-containing protein